MTQIAVIYNISKTRSLLQVRFITFNAIIDINFCYQAFMKIMTMLFINCFSSTSAVALRPKSIFLLSMKVIGHDIYTKAAFYQLIDRKKRSSKERFDYSVKFFESCYLSAYCNIEPKMSAEILMKFYSYLKIHYFILD